MAPSTPEHLRRARDLYLSGMSERQIAVSLGVHASAVHRALVRAFVPMRRKGEALTEKGRASLSSPRSTIESRFWSKVCFGPGCWAWTSLIDDQGYGRLLVKGKKALVHRVSYELFSGAPIPAGAVVMHDCDNPRCVRPDHLRLGTQKENMADAARRGRMAAQAVMHCPRGHPYSEENTRHAAGRRMCRQCNRDRLRTNRQKRNGAA
jgi:transposase-like protein